MTAGTGTPGQAAPAELTDLELLEAAARALRSFTLRAVTVRTPLDQPYRDDPRWTPWTRWLEPEARRAHDLSRTIRKRLAQDGIRTSGPDGAIPGLWPELPDGLAAPDLAAYEADIASLTDQRNRVSDTADRLRMQVRNLRDALERCRDDAGRSPAAVHAIASQALASSQEDGQ